MDSPRDGLETFDIARTGAPVVPIVVLHSQLLSHCASDDGDDELGVEV